MKVTYTIALLLFSASIFPECAKSQTIRVCDETESIHESLLSDIQKLLFKSDSIIVIRKDKNIAFFLIYELSYISFGDSLLDTGVDDRLNFVDGNLKGDFQMHIFPNPALDKLNIYLSGYQFQSPLFIEIYSANGKLQYSKKFESYGNGSIEIMETSDFPLGIYFIRAIRNNMIACRKFIKK